MSPYTSTYSNIASVACPLPLSKCLKHFHSQDPRRYKHSFSLPLTDLAQAAAAELGDFTAFLEASPSTDSSRPCSTGLTDFSGDQVELTVEVRMCL